MPAPSARIVFETVSHTRLVPVMTLIAWTVCLATGILGFLLSYARPRPSVKMPEPITVQMLQVELNNEPPLQDEELPRDSGALPLDAMAPPPVPVARPSAAIAFAVPVRGPTRVVPLNQAAYVKPAPLSVPKIERLTFGRGEGRQPAPEYPRRSIQERQQGLIVVRFVVAESGEVSSLEVIEPSVWPLLNEAAARTVRERWHFPAGNVRLFEIAIRFQLAE